MISVRGSITLSSGRYLSSVNANHSTVPYSEPLTPPCTYSSLSSATPTLSGLLSTPSLHNQPVNVLKCVSSPSSTPISSTATSHSPSSQLPYMKNKNIVAANPLLAGKHQSIDA